MTKTKRVLIDLGMCSSFFPKHAFHGVAYYQTMLHEKHISKKYLIPIPDVNDILIFFIESNEFRGSHKILRY